MATYKLNFVAQTLSITRRPRYSCYTLVKDIDFDEACSRYCHVNKNLSLVCVTKLLTINEHIKLQSMMATSYCNSQYTTPM